MKQTLDNPEVIADKHALQLATQAQPLAAWMEKRSLVSEDEFSEADLALGQVKRTIDELEADRKAIVDPLNTSLKRINAKYRPVREKLEALEAHIKTALLAPWLLKKQEAALRAAEKQAKAAEKKGQVQYAEDIRAAASEVKVPESATGLATRETWRARVVDKQAFLRAVGEGMIGDAFVEINTKLLDAMARASKGQLQPPTGVEFYKDLTIAKSV